jgi:hypothetical protein
MTDLIVDFPHQCFSIRAVRFAETAKLLVFERPKVARSELWYTRAEYAHMALRRQEDILALRAGRTSLLEAADVDDDTSTTQAEESLSFMGIEHLLTPASMNEVRSCRARCIQAVLTEQSRQGPSSRLGWERIALASLAQTRTAKLRARMLGELHQEPSED